MIRLLGIDVGTTSCKAGLFDGEGRLLKLGQHGYAVHRRGTAEVEQDPLELWEAMTRAIGDVLTDDGADSPIDAVGLCGTMPSHVFVDPHGVVQPKAMIWQDRRAGAEATWLRDTVGDDAMERYLGLRLPITAMLPPARMLWFARNRPELLTTGWTMVQLKDYLNYRLTGRLTTDITSCLGIVDLRTRRAHQEYLSLLGIPETLLPDFHEPYEVIGAVGAEAAAATGLTAGTPVVAGWIDAFCNMLGTGLGTAATGFDVTGTSEILGLTSERPEADAQGLVSIPLYHDLHVVYGLTNAGGDSLRWFAEAFLEEAGDTSHERLEALARAAEPGAAGLVFLPYLFGERSPVWDERARAVFAGVSRNHRLQDFARAVMEGLAYCVRHIIELAEVVGRCQLDTVRVSGGGARSPLLNQLKADVLGKTIETLRVQETGALGSAMLAAIGVGAAVDYGDAVRQMTGTERVFRPEGDRAVYDMRYREYRDLYPALRPVFARDPGGG